MLSTYDRETRQKTAILENCIGAIEPEKLNGVSELRFSLPMNDAKNKHCGFFQQVKWDNGETYRILDNEDDVTDDGVNIITYRAEHMIATLIDDVIFGTLQLDNLTTRAVIERILSLQDTKNWILGDCDFTRRFSYSWSNENLLVALSSIPNRFDQEYRWVFDTSIYPWKIHLKILDQTVYPQYYIREGRNLLSSNRARKGSEVCTRLYALGYGEGVNQLTFSSINGGRPYIDASPESIKKYGLIQRIWEDLRFEDPQSLLDRAKVLLKGYSEPYESYDVSVADLEKLTGEKYDKAEVGKIVQFGGYKTYITQVERHLQEVGQDSIVLANAPEDVASSIADLADRQRINSVYANGATNIYAQSFNDNADPTYPATLKFYVPSEARQINKVVLTWQLERFRAYETGAAYSGGSTQTSSSGGGSSQTSSSSGSGDYTSESGGGSFVSSDVDMNAEWDDYPTSTVNGHRHTYEAAQYDVTVTTRVPSHRHEFSISSHTHSVKIPDHTHSIAIPTHTHGIVYGIYEGPQASSVTLRVDGKSVPLAANQTEIDVVAYLGTEIGSGKIRRGTFHTIEIIPNSLTRISATVATQLFIQSEGGGLY